MRVTRTRNSVQYLFAAKLNGADERPELDGLMFSC